MSINSAVFLQIEPVWSYDGLTVVSGRVVRITQRHPKATQKGGTVLINLAIALPESAFNALEPEVVVVPDGLTSTAPIEITPEDPAAYLTE